MLRAIICISLIILLTFAYASGEGVNANWNVSYRADHFRVSSQGGWINIILENGFASLTTTLSNITTHPEEGARVSVNVQTYISPSTLMSGMKIIIGNDTVFKSVLTDGNKTVEFYLLKNYNATERFAVIFYDFGGSMDVKMSPIHVEKSRNSLNEGFLLSGIGMGVVFSVLGILAVVMYSFARFMGDEEKNNKDEKPSKKVDTSSRSVEEMDEEVIAAITGAISLYLGGRRFRIISVKPSPWKYYGRMAGMRRLR